MHVDNLGREVFFVHLCLPPLTANSLRVKSTRESVGKEIREIDNTQTCQSSQRTDEKHHIAKYRLPFFVVSSPLCLREIPASDPCLQTSILCFLQIFRGIIRDKSPKQLSRKPSLGWVGAEWLTTRLRVTEFSLRTLPAYMILCKGFTNPGSSIWEKTEQLSPDVVWCGSEFLIWGFLAWKLNGKLRTEFSKLNEGQTGPQTKRAPRPVVQI